MMYRKIKMTLLGGVIFSLSHVVQAASCCGGGSASSLILPKFAEAMIDVSFDMEFYNGYWDQYNAYHEDPPNSDLRQYRLNMGYAKRLASRWQASVTLPYVWNENKYSGLQTSSDGLGDTTVNLFYEAFDGIKCVYKVTSWKDYIPAAYYGLSLTIPTGISPYDDVSDREITGRGFYRLDGTIILDKTIFPWTATLLLSYGMHMERDVNREKGNYVEPYKKQLGDRSLVSLSGGYTSTLESLDTIIYTVAYSHLSEEETTINGHIDPTTGMVKQSYTATVAYATMKKDWVFKASWNHAIPQTGWGKNFPVTDTYTVGVSYVFQ